VMARLAMGTVITGGIVLWWPTPICMEVLVESVPQSGSTERKKQVTVFGFANAFGSPYFIFWTIFLGIVYATTQLTGQLVLALGVIALLAYLEVVDSVRDVRKFDAIFASSNSPGSTTIDPTANTLPLRFSEIVPIALLGLHTFHGTGHQSVISTIQWKTAFLLTPTVTYPFSVITVVLNSLGPQFLAGLAVPLLATWNRAPVSAAPTSGGKASEGMSTVSHIRKESVHAALGMMIYYASLLFGSAASVAVLRRHLMVWKVFAPRFMSAILGLLAVDLGVLLGVGVGVWRVSKVIEKYQ
jgi:GPI ethanolamine phosphate transferase 3 subunit O